MIASISTSFVRPFATTLVVLLVVNSTIAADHKIEVIDFGPPKGSVSKEIAPLLSKTGLKVIRGKKRTVCEIWLCKKWSSKKNFKPTPEVLYPFQPGQILGVIRYARKGSDFRDQDIAKGAYTMRYAHQPVDGSHVGTSPTRDFVLLVNADKDTSAKPIDYKTLVELSSAAAESTHPAMLSLLPKSDNKKKLPSILHNEDHDWWIIQLVGHIRSDKKPQAVQIDLVIVGVAQE